MSKQDRGIHISFIGGDSKEFIVEENLLNHFIEWFTGDFESYYELKDSEDGSNCYVAKKAIAYLKVYADNEE